MLRVLFFAQLAERLDTTHEDMTLPPDIQDARGLLALLRRRGGIWVEALDETRVQVLIDRKFATLDDDLRAAREVAFLPGGS